MTEYKWQQATTAWDQGVPTDPTPEGWDIEDGPDGAWMPFAVVPMSFLHNDAMGTVPVFLPCTYWRRLIKRETE